MLVLAVSEYLHKLLENCCMATITSLRKLGRVMIVTIDLSVVLVVAVLCTKHSWAHRTSEMIDVVFAVERGNV